MTARKKKIYLKRHRRKEMKIEFRLIKRQDKKKEEPLQSVKVRGQSLIAAIDVTPSGDDDASRQ
jgi:hypothetical protein